MASKGQMTGMLGVYLTATELTKRGYIVSPTSRSAMGADLLVTDQSCQNAWSVQVKTNAKTKKWWLMNPKAMELNSPSHMYVLVNAANDSRNAPQFYVVPSNIVASAIVRTVRSTGSVWYGYKRDENYRDRWDLFGDTASIPI